MQPLPAATVVPVRPIAPPVEATLIPVPPAPDILTEPSVMAPEVAMFTSPLVPTPDPVRFI